jgi:putative transposase
VREFVSLAHQSKLYHHRQMNRVRARTSSTHPALRFLYVGIAFALLNAWVRLKQLYACDLHRDGRRINPRRLTLLRMMHLLIRVIEQCLKPLSAIRVPAAEVAGTIAGVGAK